MSATSSIERTQVGTVEVLRHRIYPAPEGGDVLVEPAVYPLVREPDGAIRWLMTGRRSTRRPGSAEALGDGMFAVRPAYDDPSDEQVTLPSKAFTREQFREFLTSDPVVRDGDPEQRLRVRVVVEL